MKILDTIGRWAIAACMAAAPAAQAQAPAAYPDAPIKLVVAWSPGGATDILARMIALGLGKELGQQVVVDNRPGANGTIGHAYAAKAAPDGYTLILATNSTYAIAQHLYRSLPYRHERDLAPVSLVAASPLILTARPGLGVDNVAQLVERARQSPGGLNLSSGGNGSTSHLAGEQFMALTGASMTHVPYKGGGPAANAVVAGEVDVAFLDLGVALPFISAGRLKALGVGGTARSPVLPQVPSISEAGVPEFESTTSFGLFAPAGTPAAVIDKLSGAVQAVMQDQALRARLLGQGVEVVASTPEALGRSVAAESAKWGKIISERNLALD